MNNFCCKNIDKNMKPLLDDLTDHLETPKCSEIPETAETAKKLFPDPDTYTRIRLYDWKICDAPPHILHTWKEALIESGEFYIGHYYFAETYACCCYQPIYFFRYVLRVLSKIIARLDSECILAISCGFNYLNPGTDTRPPVQEWHTCLVGANGFAELNLNADENPVGNLAKTLEKVCNIRVYPHTMYNAAKHLEILQPDKKTIKN